MDFLKSLFVPVLAVVIGLIVYDMFVKGLVGGNFESNGNFEVDEAGNIMQINRAA